jgi:carbamoyl-phosphate synthase large subunit
MLAKYGVRVIGVNVDAIERGEDRDAFKQTMEKLGIEMPRSELACSVKEAEDIAAKLGFPVVVRPAYTMGGTGGGPVCNLEELPTVASRGLIASLIGQVLIEEAVVGWEELEVEVVRDAKNQKITVCFIENIDAMGVHTGDSFCAAPMLTIAPELQAKLQNYPYDVVDAIQVIGGTNIQLAHDPRTGRVVIIEINPRTSRSSALASKATGFPIALVSAKLAGGLSLDEIPYWREGTLEKYTPWGDYVVIKFSRWAFEKFKGAEDKLGTQMRAIGEVMSIGKNYKEAFQKSIRSLENGRHGLGFAKDFNRKTLDELLAMLTEPSSERQFAMYEALRKGATVEQLFALTHIKHWFIQQMKELVELEAEILKHKGRALPAALFPRAKQDGFADRYLAKILGLGEKTIRDQCIKLGVVEGWHAVPVSGVESAAYYSSYNAPYTVPASKNPKKIMIRVAAPTASARASSSTTAACTPPSRCARPATRPSWSTATPRPCRRTTTPRTSCTSSRSPSRTCWPSTRRRGPRGSSCSSAARPRSTSPPSCVTPALRSWAPASEPSTWPRTATSSASAWMPWGSPYPSRAWPPTWTKRS